MTLEGAERFRGRDVMESHENLAALEKWPKAARESRGGNSGSRVSLQRVSF
jgi:hypothetical protein